MEITAHYPADSEGRRELAGRVALAHAQAAAERLAALSCPEEQKAALFDEIGERYAARPDEGAEGKEAACPAKNFAAEA